MSTDRMPLDDNLGIRISRTVPVWAVITGLCFLVAQAVALQLGQSSQGEKILNLSSSLREQTQTIKDLDAKVSNLSVDLTKANLKGVEYDFRLNDLDRRINTLERPKGKP